jgi:hypothetical protein
MSSLSFLDRLLGKSEQKIFNSSRYFSTSKIGGIKVDVESLLDSSTVRFEGYGKNKYLQNFVINKNDEMRIGNYIVMILKFGIVNNTQLVFNHEEINRIVVFQFSDAKKYMVDVTGDDIRLNKIEKSNSIVFTGIM